MKTRWIQLIAGLAMMVLCISTCATTSNAAVVWSEDFEEGPLDDWTLYGYTDYINETEWVKTEGNFSVADGTLKVLDDEVNIARHDSDVTVGTWSFDMYIPNDDYAAIYVEIMSNGTYEYFGATNESFVAVGYWNDPDPGNAKFIVWEWVGDDWEIFSNIILDPLEGWHHIDVTRTSGGYFEFHFDGVLPTQAIPPANFTNNDVTSSTYLQFYCQNGSGAAIDNLVVRDDIIPITPPPPPIPPYVWLAVGGTAVVIVLAIVLLRRR